MLSHGHLFELGTIVVSILWRGKLSPRDVKEFAQGQLTNMGLSKRTLFLLQSPCSFCYWATLPSAGPQNDVVSKSPCYSWKLSSGHGPTDKSFSKWGAQD